MTLIERIIEMKDQNPRMRVTDIANALGCGCGYVSNALNWKRREDDFSKKGKTVVPAKAGGSGRGPSTGYLRLM